MRRTFFDNQSTGLKIEFRLVLRPMVGLQKAAHPEGFPLGADLTSGVKGMGVITRSGVQLSPILMKSAKLFNSTISPLLSDMLNDIHRDILLHVQNRVNTGEGWRRWSPKYEAWRNVQRALGHPVPVERKVGRLTGDFEHKINREIRRQLADIGKNKGKTAGFTRTGNSQTSTVKFSIGKGQSKFAMKIKQMQYGWPEGHSVGRAPANGAFGKVMVIPVTKYDPQWVQDKAKLNDTIGGEQVIFAMSRGYPRKDTHPGVEEIRRDAGKDFENQLKNANIRRTRIRHVPARPLIRNQELKTIITTNLETKYIPKMRAILKRAGK